MCLRPRHMLDVPEETADLAKKLFPKGNLYLTLRDELGMIFEDLDFEDLYPRRGQPAYSPARLALITILQFLENISDRATADAVRTRIDWKYWLGLALDDGGFNFSVLSEFRKRLMTHHAEHRLLDKLLLICKMRDLVRAGNTQRTDSTYVLAAVRDLTRLEQIGEAQRAALNALAKLVPDWLRTVIPLKWYDRYRQPIYNQPFNKAKAGSQGTLQDMGEDAFLLLQLVTRGDAPPQAQTVAAIEHLQHILGVHFTILPSGPCLKSAEDMKSLSPCAESPYDPEARFCSRQNHRWFGYSVHLTESCDEDKPHLVTLVTTAPASSHEATHTQLIHQNLTEKGLTPQLHLVDSAYVSGELFLKSKQHYNIVLLGPPRTDSNWQSKSVEAFDLSHFLIDWDQQQITCPQGKVSRSWRTFTKPSGVAYIKVRFAKQDCLSCPAKALCTRSTTAGRNINLPLKEVFDAQETMKYLFTQEEIYTLYKKRAGVEGTISQATRALGLRRTRYRGLVKTHLQHLATATALNIKRLSNWFNAIPRAKTRVSRLAALAKL